MTNEEKLREVFPHTIFIRECYPDSNIVKLIVSEEWLNSDYELILSEKFLNSECQEQPLTREEGSR